MEEIAKWLKRLEQSEPKMLREYVLPTLSPGSNGLDLSNCILATEPKGILMSRPGDTTPVSMAILRYLDVAQESINLKNTEELVGEFGAILGLATERRIAIPNTVSLSIGGSIIFLAYGAAADPRLHGPIPSNLESTIHELLERVAGLPDDYRPVLGAASQLHHSAIELFENDLRSAYLLLVSGIEVLSREFGSPPNAWGDWEDSSAWEKTFLSAGLSKEQGDTIRGRLMKGRQLRLKATFREYASTRIPDSFWDEPWDNWMNPYNASEGKWEEPSLTLSQSMRDVLPQDRKLLSGMLGRSYDMRSGLIHRGEFLALVDSAIPLSSTSDLDRPLPFAVLRSILRSLIWMELETYGKPVSLPQIRLLRRENMSAGAQPSGLT